MHLFTPMRSRRALEPVFTLLKQQAALIAGAPEQMRDSAERQV
jgi:hypothetical protein